ncbi:MAG: GNAT family N-acetyltransferase [Promethearchaeota archaeon]
MEEFENLEFRMAMPDDAKVIEQLFREFVNESGETFNEKRFQWGIERRIYDPLQRQGIFVVDVKKDDNTREVIGLIFSELRVDPFGVSEADVKKIYLKKEYRYKGIGKKLLKTLIEHLRKIDIKKILIKIPIELENEGFKKLMNDLNFKIQYRIYEFDDV